MQNNSSYMIYIYVHTSVVKDFRLRYVATGTNEKMDEYGTLITNSGITNLNNSFTNNDWPTNVLFNCSSVYLAVITTVGIYLNSKALLALIQITKVSKRNFNCNVNHKDTWNHISLIVWKSVTIPDNLYGVICTQTKQGFGNTIDEILRGWIRLLLSHCHK